MTGATLTQYSQRIDRLEFLVLVLAILLVAFASVLLLTTLRSFRRKVILRDRKGNARLTLGMSESDDPEIVLWGRDAESWLEMGFHLNGDPGLYLSDKSGRFRLSLAVLDGAPLLAMSNEEGNIKMCAGLIRGDVPGVTLCDQSGKHRLEFTLDESGGPNLMLFDGEATRRLAVGVAPSGEPALVFFGKKGEERIGFGFDENGTPFLRVLNEEGQVINQLHPATSETPGS